MKNQIFLSTLTIAAFFCSLAGCNNNVNTKPAENMNSVVHILYMNKKGQDLLNDSTSSHYIHKDIKLYYIKNGKKVSEKVGNSPGDAGVIEKGQVSTKKLKPKQRYVLAVGTQLRYNSKKGTTTTLIELQKGEVDTLKTQYESGGDYFTLTKAWYNGQLKWQGGAGESVGFIVTKSGRSPTD